MTEPALARILQVLLHVLTALLLPPLLPGLINKVKALVAGRQGPPVLQLYYDLAKLARKQAVFSRSHHLGVPGRAGGGGGGGPGGRPAGALRPRARRRCTSRAT